MISTVLVDSGTGKSAKVGDDRQLSFAIHQYPAESNTKHLIPFQSYLLNGASNDLRVDGSATNIEFVVSAEEDSDIYVKTLSLLIADNGARLNLFGALTALTNGFSLTYETTDLGVVNIAESVKTNLDMIRLGLGQPAFGSGTNAFLADISGGGADTYMPVIDLSVAFGLLRGLRLRSGTNDKIALTIKDNLSVGITQFDCLAYGNKIILT